MEHTLPSKPYKGVGMEGFTARWYASTTRKSMDEFRALARRVADELPAGGRLLEVAPGPGYFAIEAAKLGRHRVTALDISRTFVEIARRNAAEAGVAVDFQPGNASAMPFADSSFDFVFCRAAFKNFSDPVGALREMYRVLAKGGRGLIVDLRRDASLRDVYAAVDEMNLGAVNRLTTRWTFRHMLLRRAYTRLDFERLLAQTGFGSAGIKEYGIGLEVSLERT